MEIPKKISDYILPSTGIVANMNFEFELVTKEQLDTLFFVNYSDRNPAPVITKLLSEVPTSDEIQKLSDMILSMYQRKWIRLKNVAKLEYDPIHNYLDELTETVTDEGTDNVTEDLSTTNNSTNTASRNNTRTDNLSSSTTKNGTATRNTNTDDAIYGFNSTDANDSDTSTTIETDTDSITGTASNTGTQKNVLAGSDVLEETKESINTITKANSNTKSRNYTHKGNIGNLTSQQLMNQEVDFWKWNYVQSILEDLKDFLTIPIYLS